MPWSVFLKAHWEALVAADFFDVEFWSWRGLVTHYVLFVIDLANRRIRISSITVHPNGDWMMQVGRNLLHVVDGPLMGKKYLVLDRDTKYCAAFRKMLAREGIRVIRLPPRSPNLNAICERVIGTIRRECLDWLIPLSESHLRSILTSWVEHYNRGRPHSSLGPGVPDPPGILAMGQKVKSRRRLGEGVAVLAKSVLGGLHHEYSMAPSVA